MYSQRMTPFFSQRTAFYIIFLLVTALLVGSSLGVVGWIRDRLAALEPAPAVDTTYVAYSPQPSNEYLLPDSLAAMTQYINDNPEPQNVQVLTGMSTAEIANYMVSQVSGGLKVDCSYCHVISNFAADEGVPVSANQGISNKELSRQMMLMAADLNQQFVAQLPESVGNAQITCATCHNGQAVFNTYPERQNTLPDDFRVPLDLEYPGGLQVTAPTDPETGRPAPDLPRVQLNQYTMYHMNTSLGVGCTFCHNARYFPSDEVPQKEYAIVMLQMMQHINTQYSAIMNNQIPSCMMCHQGANLPPGAAADVENVPAVLSSNAPGS